MRSLPSSSASRIGSVRASAAPLMRVIAAPTAAESEAPSAATSDSSGGPLAWAGADKPAQTSAQQATRTSQANSRFHIELQRSRCDAALELRLGAVAAHPGERPIGDLLRAIRHERAPGRRADRTFRLPYDLELAIAPDLPDEHRLVQVMVLCVH